LIEVDATLKPLFPFQLPSGASFDLMADERYNPLKSRTKEAHIR
jgi:hypothetical protein